MTIILKEFAMTVLSHSENCHFILPIEESDSQGLTVWASVPSCIIT